MAVANGKQEGGAMKPVKTILVSQPKPERSPYYELEKKYNLTIDWRPFINVEALTAKEFRKQRVRPDEFSAVIFTSKNAIDHFFKLCEDMRIKVSQDMKYFCLTEAIANYLQKFIIYRKRKVFAGIKTIEDLRLYLTKHRENERFLIPCSDLGAKDVTGFLSENGFTYQEALMFRTVSCDLSDLKDITYDMLVFFSPLSIKSLFDNFPDFKQRDTRIAVFGDSTWKAVEDYGLRTDVKAPIPEAPSMTMALELYLQQSNKVAAAE
jgi:uroporphyrinogen-III synthase